MPPRYLPEIGYELTKYGIHLSHVKNQKRGTGGGGMDVLDLGGFRIEELKSSRDLETVATQLVFENPFTS